MAKTNFRQIVNPDYLGAYSLDDQNNGYIEVAGTILRVEKRMVTDMSGKAEKLVATTSLGKPMIIKATNGKTLQSVSKSKYYEDWINVPVIFYVELDVKSPQGLVDALRLKKQKYVAPIDYSKQIAAINDCKTLDEMKTVYTGFTPAEQSAVSIAKEAMKIKLTPVPE